MKKKIDKFIEKLDKLCLDSEIKKDIHYRIGYYNQYGNLYIKDNVLYGTYINKCDLNRATPAKEFLEIKIFDNNFICNYSYDSNDTIVNIVQNTLKGGHARLYKRKEKKEFRYNQNNEFNIEEIEEIFNYQKDLVYKSNLKKQNDFDTYPDKDRDIVYSTESFCNEFSLDKEWYTHEGVRIKYHLAKSFMRPYDNIEESYSICPFVKCTDTGLVYRYSEIDKETFKELMSGKINIHEVFDRIKNQKRLSKK